MSILAVDGDGRRASLWCNPETGGLYVTTDPYDVTTIPPWAVRATAFRTDHKGRLILADEAPTFEWLRNELFGSGEQGIYMPSVHESFLRGDLYQDAAGTTPVTAVGQNVGLWLDRSKGLVLGPELYAGGSTTYSPPYAEKIGDVWHLSRDEGGLGDVILASGLKPSTTYEVRLTAYPTGPGANHYIDVRGGSSGGGQISNSPLLFHEPVDVVCRVRTGALGTYVSANNPNTGSSWSFNNISVRELPGNHASQSTAASCPALQQDANGMYVLRFDGDDDWMVTPSIDFTGTDKMTVLAGVRKTSDSTFGVILEMSPSIGANLGGFNFTGPDNNGGANFGFFINNNPLSGYKATPYAAPFKAVASCAYSQSAGALAEQVKPQVNGGTPALTATGTGTAAGAFGQYPLYIGRRSGTSNPFTGDIYGLSVVGAEKSLAVIERAEALVNRYTRAF